MDDETAEIELLQQNLNKTRQISKRMTSILDSFDTRIAKLEKSILPLYTASQILNRRRNNIDKTLEKIDDVATNQEDLSAEESLILRGPQAGQLLQYKEALERLNANIAFKAGDSGEIAKIADLVETGAKKLAQVYTKIVAEASSGTPPPPGGSPETPITAFPHSLRPAVTPIVKLLRTLPLPSTHPSHPGAPAILRTFLDAQKGFADMRGNWSVKCLDAQGKGLVVRANEVDPLVTGREFGEWVELILATAEDEFKLMQELAPLPSSGQLAASFTILLTPILRLFTSVLSSLVAFVKKNLQKYSFLALAAYESLLSLQPVWEQILAYTGESGLREKNDFKDGLPVLRSLCLRSFPEFLADIKLGAMARGSDTSTKVVDFTMETVKYITKIPEVQGAVSAALLALGDGNWKMGEGVQVGMNQKLGEGDEPAILEHFIHDVISTAITSLTTISKNARRPAFGAIFLLNNVAYLRVHIDPRLLSKPTLELLLSNFRIAKAGYYDSNFTPLMQAITDDSRAAASSGGGLGLGGGKATQQAKEKFVRFYDVFDEVVERHRVGRVLDADGCENERHTVEEEVVMLVVPSLRRFITRAGTKKEFSKNPSKYIKKTPEEIESEIRTLFG
ncbi:hypothetical protein D9611_001411 [Ephemerocybe angulata]|uniref:Exocyst complex protein EXO70 n=1 Tax=Ephemerocybe angulata TaxID=980116 RepID=A0A8H5CKR8_9AGAR|nr:hypothetical protein D9611_001411 [Tulosesus angulatus]